MDDAAVRRRVKAARAIADVSVSELAKLIDQPGLGERTLRSLEGDAGRPFRPMELRAIADAVELPYEFFTEDLWLLANAPPAKPASQDELDELRNHMLQMALEIRELGEQLQSDETRQAITATRGVTQSLKGRAVGGQSESVAAGGTHGEAGATRESAQSPSEASR